MLYQIEADSRNGNMVCICCVVCWVDVVLWVDWLSMLNSGTCTVICSDMITVYGSCLVWDVWLSGLGWSGLILYSRLYLGRLWECLFLWLSVWKLCRTLFSDICCWSCMVLWLCGLSGLCALLLIYPSVLVWYRWVGVLLIFAPFRFCRKGWMWFNCTLTGKMVRYDITDLERHFLYWFLELYVLCL